MKLLFALLVLAAPFSIKAFEKKCKNSEGRMMKGTVEELRAVMLKSWDRPQVKVTGEITKIQNEDHSGSPHQKFSIKVTNDIILMVVTNLEFERIPLVVGKSITICGEFKKVGQGMVHWTHFDPRGGHADGFSILDGVTYGDQETK